MNTVGNPLFRCLVRMVITHRANTELTCEFLINEVNQYLQWNNAARARLLRAVGEDLDPRVVRRGIGRNIPSHLCCSRSVLRL